MDFRKHRLSLSEWKEMDMVYFLSSLGHEPSKIRGVDFWYLSPLRSENTPSFKVNRRLNKWYDHGMGKGGNIIDFGILYHDCSVGQFVKQFNNDFSFHRPFFHQPNTAQKTESSIKIVGESSLSSNALLKYLDERRISVEIARQYCREVRYQLNEKTYYGIGFKNDLGGWEIRNPYFKSSSSPKHITTFINGAEEVFIFEGFMDFLSFKTLHKNLPEDRQDFVVLNSLSFFERARPFMEGHRSIRLYLDRDVAGTECCQRALSLSSKYHDDSSLYHNYKDLNDWIMNFGNVPQKPI